MTGVFFSSLVDVESREEVIRMNESQGSLLDGVALAAILSFFCALALTYPVCALIAGKQRAWAGICQLADSEEED